jgi:hypothetical protein
MFKRWLAWERRFAKAVHTKGRTIERPLEDHIRQETQQEPWVVVLMLVAFVAFICLFVWLLAF